VKNSSFFVSGALNDDPSEPLNCYGQPVYRRNSTMELDAPTIVSLDPVSDLPEQTYTQTDQNFNGHEKKVRIRLANSDRRREAANLLVKTQYSWRGYKVNDNPTATRSPKCITLIAQNEATTVATMTLSLDGDAGLPADENFRDHIDTLRQKGHKLCEPSLLAIKPDSCVEFRMFAAMMSICFIYSYQLHGYDDYVIEINPRHSNVYRRLLGFQTISEQRHCSRVQAPAVLMRLQIEHLVQQVEKYAGHYGGPRTKNAFYPYFFPREDAVGIAERLRQMQST